jgi:hypothetical protein
MEIIAICPLVTTIRTGAGPTVTFVGVRKFTTVTFVSKLAAALDIEAAWFGGFGGCDVTTDIVSDAVSEIISDYVSVDFGDITDFIQRPRRKSLL